MQAMQIAKIVLPMVDNEGQPVPTAHEKLATLLTAAFGGLTAFHGTGMFAHPTKGFQTEPVYSYEVSYVPTEPNHHALEAIARTIGREAGQDFMYVSYAGGGVEILSTKLGQPAYQPALAPPVHRPSLMPGNGGIIPED